MDLAAPYDARAVANFLLDFGDQKGAQLTQLTVLKLLYFAHGWYLAANSRPLIVQDFEAWQHGPVVKVVRDAFSDFGSRSITNRATRLILQTGERVVVEPLLSNEDAEFVSSIYCEYSLFTPWQLSDMTHEPGSPWHRLWHAQDAVGRLGLRIKNEDIRAHFAGFGSKIFSS